MYGDRRSSKPWLKLLNNYNSSRASKSNFSSRYNSSKTGDDKKKKRQICVARPIHRWVWLK
jgi:hypothetical protein